MIDLINDTDNLKHKIIEARLSDLGITIDWEEEKTKEEKSILCLTQVTEGIEDYFYVPEDGERVRIVTFQQKRPSLGIKSDDLRYENGRVYLKGSGITYF